MTVVSRVTKHSLLFLALAFVLAIAATPSAKADTISAYNVQGVFSNGMVLSGQISANSWGVVTSYALNLSSAFNTASCSGICNFASGTFNMAGGSASFNGLFLPSNSLFTLNFGGLFGKTMVTTVSWSAVSVPEGPALLQAILALLTLGWFFPRKRLAGLKA